MEEFWKRVNKNKDNIRFHQAASYSPYSEFSGNWIEEKEQTHLHVNSFYRYDAIMQPLFGNKGIDKRKQEWIFDLYMHYLTELEYRTGTTRQELEIRQIANRLKDGIYGTEIQSAFEALTDEEQYYVTHMLYRQHTTRESVDKCADVLVTVLGDGIVYKNKNKEKQLMLYINKRKNEQDIRKIELICELFMPLGYDLRVFWENHFAVIGENQTMTIEEIELL